MSEKRSLDADNAENQMHPHIEKDSVMMDHKPIMSYEASMELFRKIHKSHV